MRQKPCYFCGHKETIRFAEHWIFCPECAAIYTHCIVWKGCKHVKEGTPVVRSDCWYKDVREKKAYIEEHKDRQYCSVCHAVVEADGW